MNIKKEIIDSISIITKSIVEKTCPTITFGIVMGIIDGRKCTVRLNNIDYTLSYYGSGEPIINVKYPVFIPSGNMNKAFIIA